MTTGVPVRGGCETVRTARDGIADASGLRRFDSRQRQARVIPGETRVNANAVKCPGYRRLSGSILHKSVNHRCYICPAVEVSIYRRVAKQRQAIVIRSADHFANDLGVYGGGEY